MRWREQMSELADRPSWLWSPHGDAVRRGPEPVVISEFGSWGLPHLDRWRDAWWTETGDGIARPAGVEQRFREQRLDRIWPNLEALTTGTRRLQVDALRYQVGEMRRHPRIAGLVVTEFTDAYWEANGLLDVDRQPKPYHHRLEQIFGPAMLIVDLPRHDLWSGEQVIARVLLSAETGGEAGSLRWRIGSESGSMQVGRWEGGMVTDLGMIRLGVPVVTDTTDADFEVVLSRPDGSTIATSGLSCAIVPASVRRPAPRRISVDQPVVAACFAADGHEVTHGAQPDLVVASRLDADTLEAVERGGRLLLLVRSPDALPVGLRLDRPAHIRPRWPEPSTVADRTWTGDWIGAFSWIAPDLAPNLPARAPLDFTFAEVLPDHVLSGYEPAQHASEISAGMFAGWVHEPVALAWSFAQGDGRMTLTTLHVAPETGPVATALRTGLVELATSASL